MGASGEVGSVAAEAEHGEGDERLGGVEAEGDAGQDADLGVGRLDEGVGEVFSDGGFDLRSVSADLAAEIDERF